MFSRRYRRLLCCLLGLLLLSCCVVPQVAAQGTTPTAQSRATSTAPVARMLVFYSKTCPHCLTIVNEFLPEIKDKFGDQVDFVLIEISDSANMQLLLAVENAYGIPAERATIPEIMMGYDVFLGEAAIRQELEPTIRKYLAQGGVDIPDVIKQIMQAAKATASVVVRGVLFYMPSCGHCEQVIERALPVLKQRYGDQFQLKMVDVTSDAAYEVFARYSEARTGRKDLVGVPTMIIADKTLVGGNDIFQNVDATIQAYLLLGGTDFPELPKGLDGPLYEVPAAGMPAVPTPTMTPAAVSTDTRAIHLAYFHQPGCQECDRVQLALNYLQSRYPGLQVAQFDVKEYAALNEWLGQRAGVPENLRLTAPAVFVGSDALVGDGIHLDSLEALLAKYQDTGASAVWEEFAAEEASETIIQRFRSLGVLTVLGAGLIDGLNPCAFATLIFFISYLTLAGRRGREVLLVGLAFTGGVFLAYLAVGLGLSKVLGAFDFLARIGRWVYIITAILCGALAVISFLDYLKARRRQTEEMTLSLPKALRQRINAVIRTSQGASAYMPVAFVTGVVVSLIELACTGQVYLPTIIFVLSVPELRAQALLYLVLYNLFFVAPLIVVFVLAYYGTTAAQLTKFIRTHAATIKLGTALLFLVLAGWLLYSAL